MWIQSFEYLLAKLYGYIIKAINIFQVTLKCELSCLKISLRIFLKVHHCNLCCNMLKLFVNLIKNFIKI